VIRISIPVAYKSHKASINWAAAGMTKGANNQWIGALHAAVLPKAPLLRPLFNGSKRLRLRVAIQGPAESIKLLDVHDATAKIVDQFTDVLFPRTLKSPTPQTQDRHFWSTHGTKAPAPLGRVDLWISEM